MIKININDSESTDYYQSLISTEYLGLKNLIHEKILSLRLIEFRIIAIFLLLIVPAFLGYLMAFITLATLMDLYPQNTFIGVYNYDATTNFQFNPLLLIIFISVYGILVLLLITRIILAVDLKNAKITDNILNKAILIMQDLSNNTITKSELQELFLEDEFKKNMGDDNYSNIALSILGTIVLFMLVIMWFLIKS